MAITENPLDFTITFDNTLEIGFEGDLPNPSEQDAFDFDDVNASSVLEMDMDSGFATVPILNGDAAVIQIEMEGGLTGVTGGGLEKNVIEIQAEGELVTVGYGQLSENVLQIKMQGSMYTNKRIVGNASVLELKMEASGYFGSNLSMDKEVIILSMEGLLIQGIDEDGDVVIIPSEDDAEYPNISGEEYIVVNLRTKAHSTYKDGERTAVAKTGSLNFDTFTEKAISDLFLLSRAKGPMEVVVNTKEDIERKYPLQFGETTQANLKNKKLPLAKGLRGANWTISVVVPDESHLEVRGIELYVTDLKRHN